MDYVEEVCKLKHELITERLKVVDGQVKDIYEKIDGVDVKIDAVLELQKKELYIVLGLLVTTVLILIGVVLGRAVDFKLFF